MKPNTFIGKLSAVTVKKALLRALGAGLYGSLAAYLMIPVNLDNPKLYFLSLSIGLATGFLVGVQKFIKGYIQYDK